MLIAKQIERAQAAAGSLNNDEEQATAAEGLKRDEGGAEKAVLSFSAKPDAASAPAAADPS